MIVSFCSINRIMLFTKTLKELFKAYIPLQKNKRGELNLFNKSNLSFQTKLQTYESAETVTSFKLNQNLFFNRSTLFLNKKGGF